MGHDAGTIRSAWRYLVDGFEQPRRHLVEALRQEGIRDETVLAAIGRVRREAFVSAELADRAYENVALPIGRGQTISQPYVVALMTQELRLSDTDRVLEVGTGSGYQAAILAELSRSVVSVERMPELLESARRILETLGYPNVELHLANGSLGWLAGAPYDRIIVTAAGPDVPSALLTQLAVGGRLVMPVGTLTQQRLVLVTRTEGGFEESQFGGVRFVPLVGEGAWSEASLASQAASPPEPDSDSDPAT
jgi:protein-L-isoaspartate(D-aspartate) O-methyltransferase